MKFTNKQYVRWDDLDAMAHVNNAKYLTFACFYILYFLTNAQLNGFSLINGFIPIMLSHIKALTL
jgi:acyl-CoA thioesterase FadM